MLVCFLLNDNEAIIEKTFTLLLTIILRYRWRLDIQISQRFMFMGNYDEMARYK